MALTDSEVTTSTGAATGTSSRTFSTSNTFSPSAGSMVLVRVVTLFNNSSVTSTIGLSDSHGNTYTNVLTGTSGFGVAYYNVFAFTYSTAPGSTTLTATSSASSTTDGGCEFQISPTIITGQSGSFGANTINYAPTGSITVLTASLTTTTAGSRVYLAGGVGSGSTMTAGSNTTLTNAYVGYNNAATGLGSSTTGTPGATTLGFNLSAASSFGGNLIGVEVLPGSTTITSTGSLGMAALAASGTSGETITGTGSLGLAALAASGTGTETIGTSGTLGLATLGLSGSAIETIATSGAFHQSALGASGTSAETIGSTGHLGLSALTATGTVAVANPVTSSGSMGLAPLSFVAAGSGVVTVTGAFGLAALGASGTGAEAITATGSVGLSALGASGSGAETITATGSVGLGSLGASGTGAEVVTVTASGSMGLGQLGASGAVVVGTVGTTSNLLVESGGNLLNEAGGHLLAEEGTTTGSGTGFGILTEDGNPLLNESGGAILNEGATVGPGTSGPTGPGGTGTTGGSPGGFDSVVSPTWMTVGTDLEAMVELEISGVWTDITDRVFEDEITVTRGHPDESTTAAASVFAGTLDNHDGLLSYLNPASAYYGQLGLNTPLRISIPDASAHLRLEDDQVSGASCPAIPNLGDWEIWFDADADNWQASQFLCGQWNEATNQRSWIVSTLPSGAIEVGISGNGTNVAWCYSFPVPKAHGRLSVRITYDAASGQVVFYTGKYCTDWVAQSVSVLSTGGTSASSARVQVGYTATAPSRGLAGFNGRIYAVAVIGSLGGSPATDGVALADFTALTPGETSWADGHGNAWSVNGTAEVSDRSYRFYGETAAWPQSWSVGDPNARIAISAGGLLRRLGASNVSVASPLYRAYTSQTDADTIGYWPFEDGPQSTQLASAISGQAFRWYGGTPGLASYSGFACSAPIVTLNKSTLWANVKPYSVSPTEGTVGSDAVVRFLMAVPSGGDTNNGIITRINYGNGALSYVDLIYGTGGSLTLEGYSASGSLVFNTGAVSFGVNGKLLRVSVEIVNKGGGTYQISVVTLQPGVNLGADYNVTLTGAVGAVTRVTFSPDQLLNGTSIGHVSVEGTWTSLFELASVLTGYVGEAAGVRFQRLCSEEGIAFRAIGNVNDTTPMGAQSINTLTSLLQECVDADRGEWLEPRQVLGWGYRTRASMGNQTAMAAFDYAQEHLSGTLEPTIDDQVIKNDITVSLPNGSSSRFVLQDNDSLRSVGKVGRYDTQVTINLASEAQLDSEANWILHTLTVDEPRYKSIQCDLANTSLGDLYWDALGAEAGDRLTVANPPVWLPPGLIDQVAQGMTEKISRKALSIEWNGIPSTPWNCAYTDDIVFGRADTDGSFTYDTIGNADTAIRVQPVSSAQPLWTVAPGDFPFDVNIGGEQVTVTGITPAGATPQTFTVIRSVNGVSKGHNAGTDVRLWVPPIISL